MKSKIAITTVLCFFLFLLAGCAVLNAPEDIPAAQDIPTTTQPSSDALEESVNIESPSTVFSPQDVTDETIGEIRTYDDYLTMYQLIIEDYFANYESAIEDTVLYSEEAFAEMKKTYEESFEQQKKQYGSMGETVIIGKETLVDFLITYRDSLKEVTDSLASNLSSGGVMSGTSDSAPEESVEPSSDTLEETSPENDSMSATSYQSVLDDYAQQIKDATPGLVEEYHAEAAVNEGGTIGLATICNDKVGELAKISNEGIQKMAEIMLHTGSGKMDEYQEWAGKLQDVYTEEAQKIMDAYMESAT
jgi:hypothetical protein